MSQACTAAGRPRFQLQQGPAWVALNHLLKRMRPAAMRSLLEEIPQLLFLALEHAGTLHQASNWAAVECLGSLCGALQEMVCYSSSICCNLRQMQNRLLILL